MRSFNYFHWRGTSEGRLVHFEMQQPDVNDADDASIKRQQRLEGARPSDQKQKTEQANTKSDGQEDGKKLEVADRKESEVEKTENRINKASADLAAQKNSISTIDKTNMKLQQYASKNSNPDRSRSVDAVTEVAAFPITAGLSEASDFETKTNTKKPEAQLQATATERSADDTANQNTMENKQAQAASNEQPVEQAAGGQAVQKPEGAR